MSVKATTPKNEVSKAVNELLRALDEFRFQVKENIEDLEDKDLSLIISTVRDEVARTICQLTSEREIIHSKSKMTDRPFVL